MQALSQSERSHETSDNSQSRTASRPIGSHSATRRGRRGRRSRSGSRAPAGGQGIIRRELRNAAAPRRLRRRQARNSTTRIILLASTAKDPITNKDRRIRHVHLLHRRRRRRRRRPTPPGEDQRQALLAGRRNRDGQARGAALAQALRLGRQRGKVRLQHVYVGGVRLGERRGHGERAAPGVVVLRGPAEQRGVQGRGRWAELAEDGREALAVDGAAVQRRGGHVGEWWWRLRGCGKRYADGDAAGCLGELVGGGEPAGEEEADEDVAHREQRAVRASPWLL